MQEKSSNIGERKRQILIPRHNMQIFEAQSGNMIVPFVYHIIKKTSVMSMFLDDFCEKEVISIRDCRKLGTVHNLEFDECSGCICKIIVREHCGICGFWNFWNVGEEICIPFCKIKQIGPDIILVDV